MNRLLFLLLFLIAGIECNRKLTYQENQYWKDNCGTLPNHKRRFMDEKRHMFGGTPIPGDQAPWAVQAGKFDQMCSGTLISPRHVLLASHCIMDNTDTAPDTVKQSSWTCEGDDLVLTQDNDYYAVKDSRGQLLSNKVSKMILINYCAYGNWLNDDIMIMELKEDIVTNEFAYPACITYDLSFQQNNLIVRVTAYGHNNWDPENANGQGVPNVLRNGNFKIIGLLRDWRAFRIYNEQRTTETRPGDSGGSVIHYNGRYYVIGVVSGTRYSTFETAAISVATHYNQICHHTGRCI